MLLESGADVNFMDPFGTTPITQTVSAHDYESSIRLTRKLLAAGSDVNPTFGEKMGMPPLMWAISAVYNRASQHENRAELIAMLLSAGAEINYAMSDGETALHLAAAIGDYELTKILLDVGADKRAKSIEGLTPFDMAMMGSQVKIMRLLLTY